MRGVSKGVFKKGEHSKTNFNLPVPFRTASNFSFAATKTGVTNARLAAAATPGRVKKRNKERELLIAN
jgi:hypothetical protein